MTVGKIALGVFLGNVAAMLLAWIVFAFVIESAETDALIEASGMISESAQIVGD